MINTNNNVYANKKPLILQYIYHSYNYNLVKSFQGKERTAVFAFFNKCFDLDSGKSANGLDHLDHLDHLDQV